MSQKPEAKTPLSFFTISPYIQQEGKGNKTTHLEMAKLFIVLSSLLFSAVVLNYTSVVDAKFNETTVFTWGADHSSISGNGDDLQFALDKTSGTHISSYT